MNEDRSKPLTIAEIDALDKTRPEKPLHRFGFPVAVGNTGMSLGKGIVQPTYRGDEDDIPDGSVIGATIKY